MLHIYLLRYLSFIHVKCNWYHMRTIVLTFKRNNSKTPLPETASSGKSKGGTPNKEHLFQSDLLSNHIEVRPLSACLSTEFQDAKSNFRKESKH